MPVDEIPVKSDFKKTNKTNLKNHQKFQMAAFVKIAIIKMQNIFLKVLKKNSTKQWKE